jgi:hypothetical protein
MRSKARGGDAWGPGGDTVIGPETAKHRLLENGIVFHELNYAELRAACLGLSQVLLFPNLNTFIDSDHQVFWSWCGELFARHHLTGTYFTRDEREISQLFGLACRASLAGIVPPGTSQQDFMQKFDAMEPNARELVVHGHDVLVYLAFPVLEAILKKTCGAYVQYDGEVLAPFTVPSKLGRRSYTVGKRISSIRDLLWLLYEEVANDDLVDGLDTLRAHIALLEPSRDPFDVLFRWRNSSLHGEESLPTIGGTVLNTAILVALDAISTGYESFRDSVIEYVRHELATAQLPGRRSPWSYYPPW